VKCTKSAGRKPSQQKKTNIEKSPVTKQRDLLAETDLDPPNPQIACFPLNAIPPMSITAVHMINISETLQQMDRFDGHLPIPIQQVVSSNTGAYIRSKHNPVPRLG
jgi:hypothetical protein